MIVGGRRKLHPDVRQAVLEHREVDHDAQPLPQVLLKADWPIGAAPDDIAQALGLAHQRDGHDTGRLADLERSIDVEADQRHAAHGAAATMPIEITCSLLTHSGSSGARRGRANRRATFAPLAVYRGARETLDWSHMSLHAAAPRSAASRGRLMTTLFAAQVLGSTGHSIGMAVGSIMAAGIMGTNTWSGVPI